MSSNSSDNSGAADIAAKGLAGVLKGVDTLREPFWTYDERVRVSNNLLLAKYWNTDAIKNLENIFIDALGNPISRKLVIKQEDTLYYSINNPFYQNFTSTAISTDFNDYYFLTDNKYVPNGKGTIQFSGKRFIDVRGKKWFAEQVSILCPRQENEKTEFGDSLIEAKALYEDSGNSSVTIIPRVTYSIQGATGIFELVKAVKIEFKQDRTRVVKLIYN